MAGEHAKGQELLQRGFNTLAAKMTMEEGGDLFSGQSVGRGIDGFTDTVGGGISGDGAEEEGGAGGAVLPYGKGSLEMGQRDDGAAVEGGVDGAETQDLGFGTAGGGAVEAGTNLAQGGVAIPPKLARSFIAAKEDAGCAAGPIDGTAQFAGDRG